MDQNHPYGHPSVYWRNYRRIRDAWGHQWSQDSGKAEVAAAWRRNKINSTPSFFRCHDPTTRERSRAEAAAQTSEYMNLVRPPVEFF